jgi:UDP-N-acetylmuramate--alanine ligase
VALAAVGIDVATGHDPRHVTAAPPPDRLAVTKALTAIDPDHPELVAARRAGITLEPWQQVIADAAAGRRFVAVAGTHGKSTTSGWLVHLLVAAGRDPAAFVGALMPSAITGGPPATARLGAGECFVVEADEYAGNFDPYRPDLIVLTSAEWDHPDVFADRAAVLAAFERWIRRAPDQATLVAHISDPGVAEIVERLANWPGAVLTTTLDDGPRQTPPSARDHALARTARGPARAVHGRITDLRPDGTVLEITGLGGEAVIVHLPTVGRHNAANAMVVAAAASALGLDDAAIAAGLSSFAGIGRRLERKGEAAGVVVYDDYGHHPTAIRETIAALRQREPGRTLWAVYEPLTFHRTVALLDSFAEALATADAVAVADIWAGRDPDTSIVSAADLAAAVRARRPGIRSEATGSVETTARWLAGEVRSGDAVLVMGGGHSYRIPDLLLSTLGRETS